MATLRALGARPHAVCGDVGTPEGAGAVLREVAKVAQSLDIIVHCAVRVLIKTVIVARSHCLWRGDGAQRSLIVYLVQAARPLLRRGSSIVFLSSRGSRQVIPGYGAIGAGKALAEALVRYLAPELAPLGVRINCIAPGTLDTDAVRSLFGEETDSFLASERAGNPSGRNITHDDYTGLVAFLASRDAQMIQGQVIFVNGGQYIVP